MIFERDKETGQWTVYSEVFDYMACGNTIEQAFENFEKGLYNTIKERIEWGYDPI